MYIIERKRGNGTLSAAKSISKKFCVFAQESVSNAVRSAKDGFEVSQIYDKANITSSIYFVFRGQRFRFKHNLLANSLNTINDKLYKDWNENIMPVLYIYLYTF